MSAQSLAKKGSVSKGLIGFTSLNPSVFYYSPDSHPRDGSSDSDPDLIVVIGWMAGSPSHLSKYTTPYQTLYPASSIVAITTFLRSAVFSNTAANIVRVNPVVDALVSLSKTLGREPRVLLHSFSNGGAYTLTLILQQFKLRTGNALPVKALILDSSPGKADMARTVAAMSFALPHNPVLRFLGINLLRLTYMTAWIYYNVFRVINFVENARRVTNDTEFVGDFEGKQGRRLYVFGKEDEMVFWKDVEEHANEAETKGWEVQQELFLGSQHVAHMRVDGERYWNAVKKTWGGDDGKRVT